MIDLKIQDSFMLVIATPLLLIIGLSIRPKWREMDPTSKFLVALIPSLFALSLVVLLIATFIQQF